MDDVCRLETGFGELVLHEKHSVIMLVTIVSIIALLTVVVNNMRNE